MAHPTSHIETVPMTATRLLTLFAAVAALSTVTLPNSAGGPPAPEFDRASVEASVAHLRVFRAGPNGKPELETSATGFLVGTEDGKQKWIATTAHCLQTNDPKFPVIRVTYSLPEMKGEFAPAQGVLVEDKYDLALLSLNPFVKTQAPRLRLLDPKGPLPGVDETIYMLGCPGGLSWSLERGSLNAKPPILTIKQMSDLQMIDRKKFGRLDDKLELWRHNAIAPGGYSGSPVLTAGMRVIGVQSSTLPGGQSVCFAVHSRHLLAFDLKKEPQNLDTQPIQPIFAALNATAAKPPPPPKILVAFGPKKVEVEAPFYHLGYVAPDADLVVRRYVQDQARFRAFFTVKRLEGLFAQGIELAHITNPTLGFRFLAPKGYVYSYGNNTTHDGVVVNISPAKTDPVVKPYDSPLTIAVFDVAEELRAARRRYARLTPAERAKAGKPETAWVAAKLVDDCIKELALQSLKIRVRFPDGSVEGDEKNPVYDIKPLVREDQTDSWVRFNFDHPKEDYGDAVHIGLREPVMAVTMCKYRKQDREAFNRKQPLPNGVPHYGLIASTISLY
jgi:hypothetical protein